MTARLNADAMIVSIPKVFLLGSCPLCGTELKGTMHYTMSVPLENLEFKKTKQSHKLEPQEFSVGYHHCQKLAKQEQGEFYVDENPHGIRYGGRIRADRITEGTIVQPRVNTFADD